MAFGIDLDAGKTAPVGAQASNQTAVQLKRDAPESRTDENQYSGHAAEMYGLNEYRIWGFDVNSHALPKSADPIIKLISSTMRTSRASSVAIEGHTSSSGSERNNLELSFERARSARDALAASGVEDERIVWQGAGESMLRLPENNAAAMAQNRRVEIHVDGINPDGMKKEGPAEPPKDAKQDSPGLSCSDLRENARWYRVHYMAWNYWIQDGGMNSARHKGIHDPGMDSDSIKPSKRNVEWAARDYGYSTQHDFDALYEQIAPISAGANWGAHMRGLEQEARTLEAMSRDKNECDPRGGRNIGLMTFDDAAARIRKQNAQNNAGLPQPNSMSPNGQRY